MLGRKRTTLRRITQARYKAYAWEDIEPGAYMDPDFMKAMENKGEAVSLREGDQKTTTLKLILADAPGATNTSR